MKRYLPMLVALGGMVGLTIWMTNIGQVGFFPLAAPSKLLREVMRHLQIVVYAAALAIGVGLPLGFVLTRRAFRFVSPILVGLTNMGQTLPTLAFIGIFAVVLGLGLQAAVIALAVYALLPIVRNTYAGIRSVDPATKEAARGMGMSTAQIVWKVELPLAMPVIMAGIRTSTVLNVGTAAVAGMIGAGGLGEIIMSGLAMRVTEMVLQGAAPTAGLAIALDAVLGTAEQWLTPRGMKPATEMVFRG